MMVPFAVFIGPLSGQKNSKFFYPGEALLFWAGLYEREKSSQLLAKFMKSFAYYKAWHLDPNHHHPAFVPRRTQAYRVNWQMTKDSELAEFIFEMKDWLLSMQEWNAVRYREFKGRFHDPKRPQLGPPHASATGVISKD